MHGFGWGWHRSHHEPRTGWFEKNDLYAVVFAGVAIALIYAGTRGPPSAGMDRRRHDGLRLAVLRRPRRPGAPALAVPLRAAQRLPEAAVPGAPDAPRGGGQGRRGVLRLPVRAARRRRLKRQLHALHGGRCRRSGARTLPQAAPDAARTRCTARRQRADARRAPAGAAWPPSRCRPARPRRARRGASPRCRSGGRRCARWRSPRPSAAAARRCRPAAES